MNTKKNLKKNGTTNNRKKASSSKSQYRQRMDEKVNVKKNQSNHAFSEIIGLICKRQHPNRVQNLLNKKNSRQQFPVYRP